MPNTDTVLVFNMWPALAVSIGDIYEFRLGLYASKRSRRYDVIRPINQASKVQDTRPFLFMVGSVTKEHVYRNVTNTSRRVDCASTKIKQSTKNLPYDFIIVL